MFEDSTFESSGRIHTRSRSWMLAALALDGAILLALILIPLINPEALPRMTMISLMEAPAAPVPETKPEVRPEHTVMVQREMVGSHIFAPSVIPRGIMMADRPESLPPVDVANMDLNGNGNSEVPFGSQSNHPVVRQEQHGPVRVSGMVEAGLLLNRTIPVYPPIAKATGTQGTVVLQATISRSGTIENLHAVSGPSLLQQAALDAVKNWKYRPYLLDGAPVDVETTVNVIFTLRQ